MMQSQPSQDAQGAQKPPTTRPTRLAYLVSKFPTLTETFILREIDELERQGMPLSLYTISRENPTVIHEDARPWIKRLKVAPYRSLRIWLDNLTTFVKHPLLYTRLIVLTFRELWRSKHLLVRDLFAFPKAVSFARMMQAENIRHVHAHWATHTAYMAYIIHRLTGITYSFTAHAHDIYIRKAMLCRKVKDASFVATISNFNREELVHDCGESVRYKIHIVRCGVSLEYLEPLPRREPKPDSVPTILTVASLRDYKGYPFAIEASKLLKAQGQRFQWISLGGGPDREMLQTMINEAGVNDVFCLKGPASEDTVFEAMQNADVFVLPSIMMSDRRMEGIPVALMEALAAGIPTVATHISGISELVEDGVTGRLVPERDAAALADAISDLLNQPQKAQHLAEAGRERVLGEFTASKNAARLITLFENVLTP